MSEYQRTMHKSAAKDFHFDATPASAESWLKTLNHSPETPQTMESLIDHIDRLHGKKDKGGHTGSALLRKISRGLKNPALSDADIEQLDVRLSDPVPHLGGTEDSNSFRIKYVNSGVNAVDGQVVANVGNKLNKWFDFYTDKFGKEPMLTGLEDGFQLVQIYKFADDTDDGFSKYGSPITLNSTSMAIDTNLDFTTAHELFHSMQYAYGVDSQYETGDSDNWFIEGMANWAATYATDGKVDGNWGDFEDFQHKPLFGESYSAFPFWVYISGFVDPKISKAPYWPIKTFLELFEEADRGNASNALMDLASDAAGQSGDIYPPAELAVRYTAAKATRQWKGAGEGEGYDRANDPLPMVQQMTDYCTDETSNPPAIGFTDTAHLRSATDSLSFDNPSLNWGCTNLFRVDISEVPVGTIISLELDKDDPEDQGLVACMLIASGDNGLTNSDILECKQGEKLSLISMELTEEGANSLYISVVDSSIGHQYLSQHHPGPPTPYMLEIRAKPA